MSLSRLDCGKDGLIPITKHDWKKVGAIYWLSISGKDRPFSAGHDDASQTRSTKEMEVSLLCLLAIQSISLFITLRRELQNMLHTRRKAEIEILSSPDESFYHLLSPSRCAKLHRSPDEEAERTDDDISKSHNGLLSYVLQKIAMAVSRSAGYEGC